VGGIAGSSGKNKYFEIPDSESNSGAGNAGRYLRLRTRSSGTHEIWGANLPAGISTNLPVHVRNIARVEGLTVIQGDVWFDSTGQNTLRLDTNGNFWLKVNGRDMVCVDSQGIVYFRRVLHQGDDFFPTP